MLFNSLEFLFAFLPICLAGYLVLARLGKHELALTWLALLSVAFYSWWHPSHLLVFSVSIAINFLMVRCMAAGQNRRACLVAGVSANLVLLGVFKYADFTIENLNVLSGLSIPLPKLALPLAISFFTFQQIGFLLDVYRGRVAVPGLRDLVLFVAFFPQLIAGPIVHFREMMPQLRRQVARPVDTNRFFGGLTLLLIGLFKKVVVADSIAPWASAGFASAAAGGPIDPMEAWIAALAYTFQIYFDFSGYCDMAIGLGNLFGIRLPVNFHSPYQARSIIEFWRRWHMTLSRFSAGLYLLSAGRQQNRTSVAQPDDHHAAGRTLARGELDFRGVGRFARAFPGRESRLASCPRPEPAHRPDGRIHGEGRKLAAHVSLRGDGMGRLSRRESEHGRCDAVQHASHADR